MNFVENINNRFTGKIHQFNNFIYILVTSLFGAASIIFKDLPKGDFHYDNFFENLRKIVWNCLPIATLTVSASAFIYSIHVAPELSRRGLTDYLGGLVSLALIREGVPVMATLAIISQYSSGMTAQIGSMKVSEQIDAMRIFKVYPNAYLLAPMLLAGTIGFPIVIMTCILIGIFVNYIISNVLIDINYHLYFSSVFKTIEFKDIFLALIKASVFGFFATLVSYICGILTQGGAKAVGNSTRLSIVINFILVVILDYIITALWL
jgi:phospholipid/cholesterol/gamma-HCH transport system permease protein